MRIQSINRFVLLALLINLLLFSILTTRVWAAKEHPVEITELPVCSQCHDDYRASIDHNFDFKTRHKFYAFQHSETCALCHRESFCADCHANKEEIKPSSKFRDEPKRFMPHRGDYLTRHSIDGKINPASCVRCHGQKNDARCERCHK